MKVAARLFLALSHSAHFGTIGANLLQKPRATQLQLTPQLNELKREKVESKLKSFTKPCSWFE